MVLLWASPSGGDRESEDSGIRQPHGQSGDEWHRANLVPFHDDTLSRSLRRVNPPLVLTEPRCRRFAPPDIWNRLPFSHQRRLPAMDENFGGQGAGVIIRGHHGAVGAGAHQGQIIAFANPRQWAVLTKEIAGFTNWADDIGLHECAIFAADRDDLVVGIVKSGADEVVHRRINDEEVFPAGAFDVFDASDKNAGITRNEAAWLDKDAQTQG